MCSLIVHLRYLFVSPLLEDYESLSSSQIELADEVGVRSGGRRRRRLKRYLLKIDFLDKF
jgi:hypothetical protein